MSGGVPNGSRAASATPSSTAIAAPWPMSLWGHYYVEPRILRMNITYKAERDEQHRRSRQGSPWCSAAKSPCLGVPRYVSPHPALNQGYGGLRFPSPQTFEEASLCWQDGPILDCMSVCQHACQAGSLIPCTHQISHRTLRLSGQIHRSYIWYSQRKDI
jgi:hypothetical protein